MYHVAMIEYSDGESDTLNIAADCDEANEGALPFDITDCSSDWTGVRNASTFTAEEATTNLLSICRPISENDVQPLNIVEVDYSFATKRITAEQYFTLHFRTTMDSNDNWFVFLLFPNSLTTDNVLIDLVITG